MSETVDDDPFGPATMADPASAHAELRARCPVHRYDGDDHPMYSVALELDGGPTRIASPFLWGKRTMPVRW